MSYQLTFWRIFIDLVPQADNSIIHGLGNSALPTVQCCSAVVLCIWHSCGVWGSSVHLLFYSVVGLFAHILRNHFLENFQPPPPSGISFANSYCVKITIIWFWNPPRLNMWTTLCVIGTGTAVVALLPCTVSFTLSYPSCTVSLTSSTTSAVPRETREFRGYRSGNNNRVRLSRTTSSGVGIVNVCSAYREFHHLQRY